MNSSWEPSSKHLQAGTLLFDLKSSCLWLHVPPSFHQGHPFKRKKIQFSLLSKMHWNASPEISGTDFYLCCWRKKKKEVVFFFIVVFFPFLFGFGMQMMTQLDEQAREVNRTTDPAHPDCRSCGPRAVLPRHRLQGRAPCYRACVTSPWSRTRTFCLNFRFYLKKSILVSSARTDGSLTERSVWRPSWGGSAARFCAFPYDQESQQLVAGFVSTTLHVWPKASWLASPSCLLGSCPVRQMPVVTERNSWLLEKEHESRKAALGCVIYAPSGSYFPQSSAGGTL